VGYENRMVNSLRMDVERREMKRSGLAGEKSALKLLAEPDRLLSAVLFWNLVINVAYFSISSIVAIRIEKMPSLGSTGAWLFASATLLLIIFFSEMLPKTFAVLKPGQYDFSSVTVARIQSGTGNGGDGFGTCY